MPLSLASLSPLLVLWTTLAVAIAEHDTAIDTSQPYYIISSSTSRSPNEYFYWSGSWHFCNRNDEDYELSRCVPSDKLPSGELPPRAALWWFKPAADAPGFYNIVSGIDSKRPAMMLSFDWQGNVYPYPWWDGDASYTIDYMSPARFRLQPAKHVYGEIMGDRLYYIVCGPESGKADEMIFYNRQVGDWLDTWTADFTDVQATWRLVPAPCEAYNCTQPNYAAAYEEWKSQFNSLWLFILVLVAFACCFFGAGKNREAVRNVTMRRGLSRQNFGGDHGAAAPAAVVQMQPVPVAAGQPVVAQAVPVGVVPVGAVQAVPVQGVPVQAGPGGEVVPVIPVAEASRV